jgi:putative transcriptional regulator
VTKTAAQARAAARVDRARVDATTPADRRRHALEDGEDLDDNRPFAEAPESIRRRLGMSQARFAAAIRAPPRTVQNWEQRRTRPDRPAGCLAPAL